MSNRRMGGMGGPQRGNRSFSQQPFQGGVNPWQGGNNMNQGGGLISQITSNPQLALALTSLLQPQQQQMNNPPSLLSLNPSPAFSNQDRNFNRFGNRGRDMRRHEPYNKNRGGGWRPMEINRRANNNNNNRHQNQGGRDHRRSPARDFKRDDRKEKKQPERIIKKEKTDTAESVDLLVDEEKEVKKRDWKDEKNTVDEKHTTDDEDQTTDPKSKEGRYTGVPISYLKCFVCNKEMWDGESMEKHIKGRAHSQMLKALEESIHITVNILRENMRLIEERKVIEWNRMNRLKKYNKFEPESNCNMCDLKFMGKIIAHRKTEGHQRLKRYLHPDCHMCNKEFPSRMEWIEHRLTPEHLRKLNEHLGGQIGGIHGKDVITEEDDIDLEPLLEEPLQMEVENPILELDDNLEGMQNLMPSYKPDRAVSTKSLVPFTGFMCELCNRSFHNEEEAQEHLKTKRHYFAFLKTVKDRYMKKEKSKKRKQRESEREGDVKEEREEEEEKQEENGEEVEADHEDHEMYDPEEATNEEEKEEEAIQETEVTGGGSSAITVNVAEIKEEMDEESATDNNEAEAEPIEEEPKQVANIKTRASLKGNVKNVTALKGRKARKS